MRTLCLTVTLLTLWTTSMSAVAHTPQESRHLRRTPVVDVFESARDAVVNISSTQIVEVRRSLGFDSFFEEFFDMPRSPRTRQYKRTSVGSGFVIHPGGYIVTNAHVVAKTATRTVTFADGREYEAELVAIDTDRDIAVLHIDVEIDLKVLPLGHSDDLMIGETVIAIGNPLGYQHTVTSGVVSATNRDLEFSRDMKMADLIQTDASINPGNSGGPLLNVLGELIGINTAIRGDAQNIGFAIPVDQLRAELPGLLDVERRYRIQTGLRINSLRQPRIEHVAPGSPGEEADIRPGDVLIAIDDQPVSEGVDFCIALIGRAPGERLNLKLKRGNAELEARLRIGERMRPDGEELAWSRFGIRVKPCPPQVAAQFLLDKGEGLLVADVEPGSPADKVNIDRGEVLVAIGRLNVPNLEELGMMLDYVESGEAVTLVLRGRDRRGVYQFTRPIQAR